MGSNPGWLRGATGSSELRRMPASRLESLRLSELLDSKPDFIVTGWRDEALTRLLPLVLPFTSTDELSIWRLALTPSRTLVASGSLLAELGEGLAVIRFTSKPDRY